jgi:tRNA(fMet)-specific endonuclease VapC
MLYLLDTNIVSDVVRNPKGSAARRIRQVGEVNVCTSIIVACELRFGAAKRGSKKLTKQLEVVLERFDIAAFDSPADETYANLRLELEKQGKLISGNDLFIAAHAVALGATLVSANEREFSRVDGLTCENWLS